MCTSKYMVFRYSVSFARRVIDVLGIKSVGVSVYRWLSSKASSIKHMMVLEYNLDCPRSRHKISSLVSLVVRPPGCINITPSYGRRFRFIVLKLRCTIEAVSIIYLHYATFVYSIRRKEKRER